VRGRATALALPVAALLAGCPGQEAQVTREPTYANVAEVLNGSCAFSSSCHGGTASGKAGLNLAKGLATGDVRPTLAKAACEYPPMKLVAPGAPGESWLLVKLTSDHGPDGKLTFTPSPSWKPDLTADGTGKLPLSECPLTEGGSVSFGYLMPSSPGSPTPLPAEDVELIRSWIAAGAPGPR
jgi:hypothetical protein